MPIFTSRVPPEFVRPGGLTLGQADCILFEFHVRVYEEQIAAREMALFVIGPFRFTTVLR
jgi:hypothetical protein